MKDTIQKTMFFRFDRYQEIEHKLEKFAAQGLFLEKCGSFFWTFRKGTPQKLKYTVTYFSEGSVYNPEFTENQQTYFDYAAAAGWTFVTDFNAMQIFCSKADNPIPFETDETEKLENIKKCINKKFLPYLITTILVFLFNLAINLYGMKQHPIDFFSDPNELFPMFTFVTVVVYYLYCLFDYLLWCKRSETSIASGGECANHNNRAHKITDIIFLCLIFGNLSYLLLHLSFQIGWFGLFLSIAQVPILIWVFIFSIRSLKKKKASHTKNKIISCTVLILVDLVYTAGIVLFIAKLGLPITNASHYRTVSWPITATYYHEYKLYHDEIPLICEDLYGPTDYAYYSYESDRKHTFLLSKDTYRQDSLPAKDAPPSIEYQILEPQFNFVYALAQTELLEIPDWRDNESYQPIDNHIFNTINAYQCYYEEIPTGEFLLFYKNKIIVLSMQQPPTIDQIAIIQKALHL